MDYFWIKQDKRYIHTPELTNVRDIVLKRSEISIENEKKIADINVAFARSERTTDFVDVLDSQLFLVRDRVKEVLEMYEPGMIFKTICILANITGEYGTYYLPLFPKIDCISEESITALDKSKVTKLVLNSNKLESQYVFQVAGLLTDVTVIRLDVMESLLRRKITEFQFERIKISTK